MMLKSLLVAAACVGAAVAQSTLAFTTFPSAQQPVGQPVEIKWEGGNSGPVTITLRQGEATNLQDVAVLTSSATGGSYTWVPSASLPSGSNYALQISQGANSINYSGLFAVTGGSAAPASVSASASLSSITSAASSVLSSAKSALSSQSSVLSSLTAGNATSTASASSSGLSTRPTASSTGSTSRSGSSTASSSGTPSSTGGATGSSGAAGLSSPIALIFGAVAAMLYLN